MSSNGKESNIGRIGIYQGHAAALFTIVVWGTTFISTKVLLRSFQPMEILLFRFLLGYAALWCVSPRRPKWHGARQELTFMGAGLCGICLYYLLENIALTYTLASNVGVIISVAPFFTALFNYIFIKRDEKPDASFLIGFLLAMAGIAMISFGGSGVTWNIKGDLLAAGAALVWACYSILTKKSRLLACPRDIQQERLFSTGLFL